MRRHPNAPQGNPLRLASSNQQPPGAPPEPLPAGTDIAGAFLAAAAERHGGITLTRDDVLRFSRRLVVIEPAVLDPGALTLRVVEDTPAAVARHWATTAVGAAERGDHRGASEALREFGVAALMLDADTAETLRAILLPILGPRAARPRGGIAAPVEPAPDAPADVRDDARGDAPVPPAPAGLGGSYTPDGL